MKYVCIYTLLIMIRAGVFGSGETLEKSLDTLRNHSEFLITGYHSGGTVIRKNASVKQFMVPEDLISVSEALIITNNPADFHEVIPVILKHSRHLLIFPNYSLSFYQLENMVKLAEEAGVVFYLHQDGIKDWMHDLSRKFCEKPEFIEVHTFIDKLHLNPNTSIFDSLYKAISAVMKLNRANVRKFYTNLVPYCSPDPLMTNVRLVFENGTSANITINAFFERNDSRIEVFRNDTEVIIDPFASEVRVISKNPNSSRIFKKPAAKFNNVFLEGLDGFALRILSSSLKNDPFESGIIAHKTATIIIHQFIPYPIKTL